MILSKRLAETTDPSEISEITDQIQILEIAVRNSKQSLESGKMAIGSELIVPVKIN